MIRNIIRKIKRNLFYIVVVLSSVLYTIVSRHINRKIETSRIESTINNLNQEIKRTKVQMNDSITLYQAEIQALCVTRDNLKDKYKKLLKASKTKPKQVESITEITSVVHRVDTVYARADSLNNFNIELKDQFLDLKVSVFPDKKTIIDYRMRDSLTVISLYKKHSILFGLIKWKKHKGVKVINHNPKSDIVSLKEVSVLE